jgi:hypothetical protein
VRVDFFCIHRKVECPRKYPPGNILTGNIPKFHVPSIVLSGDVTAEHLKSRQKLWKQPDVARSQFENSAMERTWKEHQQRTLDLLYSSNATKVFDCESESEATRARCGSTINGTSLLLARSLVEAGTPFANVFWKENEATANQCKSAGGWETHGNNFECLKMHLLP